MSRVLVYQANGVQGAATARRVRQAGYTTRVLIRNGATADALRGQGMEVAVADLCDREALRRAHDSVDYAMVQVPATTDTFVATAIGNATAAMEAARVKGAIIKMANPGPRLQVPDSGFSANAIIRERLAASAMPHSIVEPTMYLDTFLKPGLRHEIAVDGLIDFPMSAALKVAWTTVDDAARLSMQLLQSGAFGRAVRCAGAVALDGHELAATFSQVLQRRIAFRSTPLEEFQAGIESAIGAKAAFPAVAKFRFLADHPEEAQWMLRAEGLHAGDADDFSPTSVREWMADNRRSFLTW